MEKPRIVFWGTPEFAVPCLEVLIERKENLVGVVTQPDRPVGRGRQLKPSPVKQAACGHHLAVLQPETIRGPVFLQALAGLRPDLLVVVAYGRIIPRTLLGVPACGSINVHASLLPAYRGAAPINWALINGETRTGITIMLLDEGMDTGDILMQEAVPILPEDNVLSLHDRLSRLGARLLAKTVDMLRTGCWRPVPQDHAKATYAPLLKKQDGLINWNDAAIRIANKVRGMNPWPGCFTYLEGELLKIHRAAALDKQARGAPGSIMAVSRQGIEVAGRTGCLLLQNVQLEGRHRMSAEQFIRGHRVAAGMHFSATR